jgi:serine/threonine-protein kinase
MAHGRYTIVGKLADGGMAEIFLATQHGAEGFEKLVVMKRVLTAFSADPQFRNMFIDEAHISMSLSHGNIVQVLDVGVAAERTFLVLELVEGWDLELILERAQATGPDHPWPPSLALYVTAQVCRALSYAHAKRAADGRPLGIVHRDVNPTNVLVSEQGEVKLADFGIAKAERKREQTGAGIIKGKIGFMSPEQALGRALDARADLFSVGTMLYLMLTGRRPFEASSELESMLRAQRAEYPPPETLNTYLPQDATTIVNRAMRREASARYQTADEMLVDVERVLRGHYNSAGQTELKLWLAELARRDGAVPMGRLSAVPSPHEDGSGDLSAGVSVELSDIGVGGNQPTVSMPASAISAAALSMLRDSPRQAPARAVSPVAAGMTASPPGQVPTPPGPAAPTVVGPVAPVAGAPATPAGEALSSPVASKRRSRRSRIGVGFMLGALCMLGAVYGIKWLAGWAGREGLPLPRLLESHPDAAATVAQAATQPPRAVAPATPDASAAGGDAARAIPQQGIAAAPAAAKDAASPGTAEPKVADKAVPSDGPPVGKGEQGEKRPKLDDEAAGDKEASAGGSEAKGHEVRGGAAPTVGPGAVIGEDEADTSRPTPPPKKSHRASSANSTTGASATAGKPPQPVTVRITSSPLGAEVRTKKQMLGRTPIAIRFNPGNTYELTFVKAGYVTSSRMVAVGSGKPKSVSVPMKRAPSPARRGLFRGR